MIGPKPARTFLHAKLLAPFMKPLVTGPCDRKDGGLRRLMSRKKKGRDALRSSQAHPQAGSIAPAWAERSQRRVPLSRHRPKSAKIGEAHSAPGAHLRHMRRRARNLPRGQRHKSQVLTPGQGVLQQNPSIPAALFAQKAPLATTRRTGQIDSKPAVSSDTLTISVVVKRRC
jgi:hypothetical protein